MKVIVLMAAFLILSACQEKDATPEFQSEVFNYIKTKWSSQAPKCDPSFSTWRNEELTVYCLPLSEKQIASNSGDYTPDVAFTEVREWTKAETTKLVMNWTNESNRKTKSVLTRFTDEIVTDQKK